MGKQKCNEHCSSHWVRRVLGWGGETEVFSNERKTIDVGEVVGLAVVRAVVGAIKSSP